MTSYDPDIIDAVRRLLSNSPSTPRSDGDLADFLLANIRSQSTSRMTDYLPKTSPSIPLPLKVKPILPVRVPLLRITPTTEAGAVKRVRDDVARIIRAQLRYTNAQKIPQIEDIAYDETKTLEAAVMHIDIRQSSKIAELYSAVTALKIYKIFHSTVVTIIKQKGGQIRTFAGDRIAAFFDTEKYQRTRAVETALFIQAVIDEILNPVLSQQYRFFLEYGIGIDFGKMLVGRIGQYGSSNNDLVWAGVAVNHASKLADYDAGIFISSNVYTNMASNMKAVGMIWTPITHTKLGTFYKYNGLPKELPHE